MFRFLVPRQHGNIITSASVLSQVFKGCNSSEPLKLAAGAWNSRRFVKTEKGLPGGTIKEVGGAFGKMAAKNEEEYFYKKTKKELEELKHRIQNEPISPPVKQKLEQEALNLDLQLRRIDLRAVIERAEEDRQKMKEKELGKQIQGEPPLQKETDSTKLTDSEQLQHQTELKPKKSRIKKSGGNVIHYSQDNRVPLQQPPYRTLDKNQQALELQQLENKPGTPPEQPRQLNPYDQRPHMIENKILRKQGLTPEQQMEDEAPTLNKKLLERTEVLKTMTPKTKQSALMNQVTKTVDLMRLGRTKKGSGRRKRRKSELQKSIEEAEKAFKDPKERK